MNLEQAYQTVKAHYGDRKAERSGVPLIYHIDEGLTVLGMMDSSSATKAAWCLHPLFQADPDLRKNLHVANNVDGWTMMLVMEYRNQANAWLSDKIADHSIYSTSGLECKVPAYSLIGYPSFGPLPGVREMLVADKVQNYKDFKLYHADTHPRRHQLTLYFETWLSALAPPKDVMELLK
jgi:hypothetical protein